MPQTGAAGFHRPDRRDSPWPAPITAFDPDGEISVTDGRAALRAAAAEQFAQRFGVDGDRGPSADALADRFGFRYEQSRADPEVASGRRTVTITGHGAGRLIAPAERTVRAGGGQRSRRGVGRRREPAPLRADRIAMLAVALALLLAFVAATSAHAATLAVLVSVR
jgi:hypothetical protein